MMLGTTNIKLQQSVYLMVTYLTEEIGKSSPQRRGFKKWGQIIHEGKLMASRKRGLMILVSHMAHYTPTLSGNGTLSINMGKISFLSFTCQ